jgi:hypothetical protein
VTDPVPEEARRIEWRPLSELKANPRNPKGHSDETITESISRFGYIEPIVLDGRTGYIVSGHGRTEALRRAEAADPASPPDGVKVAQNGSWLAPVVTGWDSADDIEATAALIALNRTTELGGWVDEQLLEALDVLGNIDQGLAGVGFTEEDIEALRLVLEGTGEGTGEGPEYTRKADIPQYTPTSDEAPPVSSLADATKTLDLVSRITSAEDLDPEVRSFLIAAAARHTVFHYGRIAEFYAHADPAVQALMEESALVMIDTADAIRLGYVKLNDRMADILATDRAEIDLDDEYEDDDLAL